MNPIDIGIDAARALARPGPGQVLAVFSRALYLRIPGGLVALCSSQAPRGPLHVRTAALPPASAGARVTVSHSRLEIGGQVCSLTAPIWSPRLPQAAALVHARPRARDWLPNTGPTLDLGPTRSAELPGEALNALRRGDLLTFAELVGGRGPGLTPAGDDVLAGVLLVARALRDGPRFNARTLRRCARRSATNDIARAFLMCAARGRCIEPAHALLTALADADRSATRSALTELCAFGSSSGEALAYGIRTALLELPRGAPRAVAFRRSFA
jgi:uncharacterized protein DUF2877